MGKRKVSIEESKKEHTKRYEQDVIENISKEDVVNYNLIKYRSIGDKWIEVKESFLSKRISWVQLILELLYISERLAGDIVTWEKTMAKLGVIGDEIKLHHKVDDRINVSIYIFNKEILVSISCDAKDILKSINKLARIERFKIEVFMEDSEINTDTFDELGTDEEIVDISELENKKCHIMMAKVSGIVTYVHSEEVLAVIVAKVNQGKNLINFRVNNTYFVEKEDNTTAKISENLFMKTDHNKKDILQLIEMIDNEVLVKIHNYELNSVKKEWEI